VSVAPDAAVTGFVTGDHWYADRSGSPVRTPWSTPVDGWQPAPEGRMLPTTARATWLLPEGELTHAEVAFAPGEVVFNVGPVEV
jgi:hypothetical protein